MTKTLTTLTGLAALLIALPVYAQDAAPEDGAGKNRPMERGGRMMQRFDTDDDGGLSMEEFMDIGPGDMADADTDGDGEITFDEMKAAWHGLGQAPPQGRRSPWPGRRPSRQPGHELDD